MKIKLLSNNPRFNEPIGFLFLFLAIGLGLSLLSYSPADPSLSVASAAESAENLFGLPGAYLADLVLQMFGLAGFFLPAGLMFIGWRWIRSLEMFNPSMRLVGTVLLATIACCALSLLPLGALWNGTILPGGIVGAVLAERSVALLNIGGTILLLIAATTLSFYFLTSLHIDTLVELLIETWTKTKGVVSRITRRWHRTQQEDQAEAEPLPEIKATRRSRAVTERTPPERTVVPKLPSELEQDLPPIVPYKDLGINPASAQDAAELERLERMLGVKADEVDEPKAAQAELDPPIHDDVDGVPWDDDPAAPDLVEDDTPRPEPIHYTIPSTGLLNPPLERGVYDPGHLHELSRQIVEKFDEFGVRGSVAQINPGPVVTTFEFKPDRGVKYSKVINLSEDLCLALECESILVERIPGKSTVGIEVPNKHREIIGLKEVLDSPDFRDSKSFLTVALGKDISGKIHVADLSKMPHVLVAGSTGSGKSVLVNCVVMSILLRATPDDVRFIMIDPKTVELGLYEDIPHLLTPVITDMKKATNALKNATHEMERRLKLLAEHGVRNIDQYNEKISKMQQRFERSNPELAGDLSKLPYIVVIVDELADLMMLEGRAVEESITRLAQMARAVGIHLLLATQRPSVDVITGLIKANIPARISFRLATRVDSRTILDSMGAESLLGRGDMLYLPPGTARMKRLHGPLVTEEEIQSIVKEWKEQAAPEYQNDFLQAPVEEREDTAEDDAGFEDEAYQDAVRIVLEMGKASTSTLQRRLRLGYGRAARILDAMERDGIIGPPDGSRPRPVLKRPDWLAEVEST